MSGFPPTHREYKNGFTLIEVLIAIVLLGGVILGSMAALRAATIGGTIHRDHSRAHAWLQSASDILYAVEKEPCSQLEADGGEQRIRDEYDIVINAIAAPIGWEAWQLRIVPDVQFWNAANLDADPDVEYYFGADCDPSLSLQLIKLEVRSPDGAIIENVEIIK